MKTFILTSTFFCLLICACSGPSVKPEVYNDSLVIQQIRVIAKADELQDAFNSYVEAEMRMRHQQLSHQVETSLGSVQKMEDYDGDDSFRKSALTMLEGYDKLLKNEYTEAEKILAQPDSMYSDGDEARLEILYKQIDKKTEELMDNFKRAQDDFAKKYKLNLKADTSKTNG